MYKMSPKAWEVVLAGILTPCWVSLLNPISDIKYSRTACSWAEGSFSNIPHRELRHCPPPLPSLPTTEFDSTGFVSDRAFAHLNNSQPFGDR